MKSSHALKLAPLFLIITIDSMGMGLLIPSLTAILIVPNHYNIASHLLPAQRQEWYGIIMSIYMLCWFFSASLLGDLSDQIGRKRVLAICLIGAAAAYTLLGIAAAYNSLTLMIMSRIIGGFTAGSQAIAQAAIADVSDENNKAHCLGMIIMFSSLGFIAGPLLGGILSYHHLVSWFSLSTPFYFAAVLSLINIVLLYMLFKETFVAPHTVHIDWTRSVKILATGFKRQSIRHILIVFTLFMFSWGIYYCFISVFLATKLHFNNIQIALLMAVMAVGFSIGSGFLAGRSTRYVSLNKSIVVCIVLSSLFILGTAIGNGILAWVFAFLIGTFLSISYALLLTLASNQVTANEQGWIMGVTSSVNALAMGISLLLSGITASIGITDIMLISAVFMLISGAVCLLAYRGAVAS